MLEYLLIGVGFTGAFTLRFVARWLGRHLYTVPTIHASFSPKGGCTEIIVNELRKARREILVQAYSFTCPDIAKALIDAKKRGVKVTILLDRSNEKETHSELAILAEHDLWPLIDAHHAIAHNKIMIIDRRTLLTGSFNFTRQAEHENAENLLVLRGHWELIEEYRKNFLAHQEHCQAPGTAKVPDPPKRFAKAAA
ncbi:MAG TPA: phospholipase D family protein [Gemmataceae bacterium]|nr:phospholipase D family protein [Gemmataceae bacterium]